MTMVKIIHLATSEKQNHEVQAIYLIFFQDSQSTS